MRKAALFSTALITLVMTTSAFIVSAQQNDLIYFNPTSGDLKIGEEKIVSVTLNSSSKISGFDLKFNSSGSLKITDFENSLTFGSDFDPFNARQVTEKIEGIDSRIAYVFTSEEETLPQSVTLFLKIKGDSPGQGKITLDYNNSQIIDRSGKPLQITPLSATYNLNQNQSSSGFIDPSQVPPTKYPETAAVVNIRTKLYGASATPGIKVKATAVAVGRVGEGPYETQLHEFYLTSGPDGVFSGKFAFPEFKDGNKFSLMIRADKYLLKRICDASPVETKPGEYRCQTPSLTIRSGEEASFDFSGISLLVGDLGMPDGFLNGYDLGIVRNNLGKNDFRNNALADLNYDNQVNSEDFKIIEYMANTTSRKADQ
jgi:hypothetical protein